MIISAYAMCLDLAFVAMASRGIVSFYLVVVIVAFDFAWLAACEWAGRGFCGADFPKEEEQKITWARAVLAVGVLVFSSEFCYWPMMVVALAMVYAVLLIMRTLRMFALGAHKHNTKWLRGTKGKIGAPNWVTFGRMAMAFVIVDVYATQPFAEISNTIALVLMVITLASDALDGYLARELNQRTLFGQVLDPASDKLIFWLTLAGLTASADGSTIILVDPIKWAFALCIALIALHDILVVIWAASEIRLAREPMGSSDWDRTRFMVCCFWLVSFGAFVASPINLAWRLVLSLCSILLLLIATALSVVTIPLGLKRIANNRKRAVK